MKAIEIQSKVAERARVRLAEAASILEEDEARWSECHAIFYEVLGEFHPLDTNNRTPPHAPPTRTRGYRPMIPEAMRDTIRDFWRRMVVSPCFDINFKSAEENGSTKKYLFEVTGRVNYVSLWSEDEFLRWMKMNKALPLHYLEKDDVEDSLWDKLFSRSVLKTLDKIPAFFHSNTSVVGNAPPFDDKKVVSHMKLFPEASLRGIMTELGYSMAEMAKCAYEFSLRFPSFEGNVSLMDFLFEP